MAFDLDLFASAVSHLSNSFRKTAKLTGIPQIELACALRRHANDRSEAKLWENIASLNKLGDWIYKQRKRFNAGDEAEILNLSHEIPTLVRRRLIEIAKSIPAPRGGKQPALDFAQKWDAKRQVKKLSSQGCPIHTAYKEVAAKMGVSAHTIRRCCDVRERSRNHN